MATWMGSPRVWFSGCHPKWNWYVLCILPFDLCIVHTSLYWYTFSCLCSDMLLGWWPCSCFGSQWIHSLEGMKYEPSYSWNLLPDRSNFNLPPQWILLRKQLMVQYLRGRAYLHRFLMRYIILFLDFTKPIFNFSPPNSSHPFAKVN